MSDLDDLDIRTEPNETRPYDILEEEPANRNRLWLLIAVGALVIAAATYFLFFRTPDAPPEVLSAPEPELPAAAVSSPVSPDAEASQYGFEEPLPPLAGSDEAVARIVGTLSSHPRLLTWLATPDLIRTAAAAIENISSGVNPSPHLGFLTPRGGYQVRDEGGTIQTDPATYRRYDLVTAVFTSLDPEGCAAAYRHLRPLLEEVH